MLHIPRLGAQSEELETDSNRTTKAFRRSQLRGGCPRGFHVSREPRIRVFIGKQRGKGTRMTSDTGYVGTPPSRISPSKMPTAYLLVPPRRGLRRPPVLPAIKTVLNHPRSCNGDRYRLVHARRIKSTANSNFRYRPLNIATIWHL